MKNLEDLELKNLTVDEMKKIDGGTMVEDFIDYCIQAYNSLRRIIDSY